MRKKLILIGAGGHAKACIDVIEQEGQYEIAGLLDLPEKIGRKVLGYEVVGTDNDIASFIHQRYWFLIVLGQIRSPAARKACFISLQILKAPLATIVSPHAYVSRHASVGDGSIIMHGAKINAGAKIEKNCIINTNADIEHDAVIGDHNHISTHAVVNGDCKTGECVFIGSGAVIQQGIEIIKESVIGAGALVHKNIVAAGTYVGNPFTRIN